MIYIALLVEQAKQAKEQAKGQVFYYDLQTRSQALMHTKSSFELIGRVGRLHKPRVEQASFAVLKAPYIPIVLVEGAFISNPEEEAKLVSAEYQGQLADALMRGIQAYFAKNPPLARNRQV